MQTKLMWGKLQEGEHAIGHTQKREQARGHKNTREQREQEVVNTSESRRTHRRAPPRSPEEVTGARDVKVFFLVTYLGISHFLYLGQLGA